MYFFVKYTDYEDFKKAEDKEDSQQDISCNSSGGKPKELIVNSNCYIGIILDYIYKEVGIDNSLRDHFDLCTEKARVINVGVWEPNASGLNLFNGNTTYYVVYRDIDQLKPLLNKKSTEYLDFLAYQKRRSSISKKSSSLAKSSHSKSSGSHRSNVSRSKSSRSVIREDQRSKSSRSMVLQDQRSKSSKSFV